MAQDRVLRYEQRMRILSLRRTISLELIVFLSQSPWLVTEIVTNYYTNVAGIWLVNKQNTDFSLALCVPIVLAEEQMPSKRVCSRPVSAGRNIEYES